MKPYPAYKDSGIDWLGEIPEDWDVRKLKHIALVQISNVDKKSKDGEKPTNLCNYTDVYYQELITDSIEFMEVTASENQLKDFRLNPGDVIITKDSETPDDIAVPAYVPKLLPDVICGYHLSLIRPNPNILFGGYLFRSFQTRQLAQQFEKAANGITRFGIGKWSISNSIFILPAIKEQKAIAAYLDRKTQQIDRLLEIKEKQVELLLEQRTGIINQAVTKGLNPNVKMRDSGIVWLGEIPEGWGLIPMKYLTKKNGIVRGPFGSALKIEFFVDNGFKVYEQKNAIYKNIALGSYFIDEAKYIELKRFSVDENDLIISCSGTIGKIYKIPSNYIPGVINQALLKLSLGPKIHEDYFSYIFESYVYQILIVEKTQGGAMKNLVGIDTFKLLKFITPPIQEQIEIINYLDHKMGEIDKSIESIQTQIDKLKEYRTALISDVVTGKVDVRGEMGDG